MSETAIAIYVPFTIGSSGWQPALEMIDGRPAIVRLVERLRAHSPLPVFMVCQKAADAERLGDAVAAEAADRVSVLARFCREHQFARVAVFARDSIVPDCARMARMIAEHAAHEAQATFPTLYPPGLLPEVIEASLLDGLRLDPRQANQLSATLDPAVYRVRTFARDHRAEPGLERLPRSALLLTPAARMAAARVRSATADHTPALEFGAALAEIERTIEPDVPAARSASARRVLFVTLADLYSGAEESLLRLVERIGDGRYEPVIALPGHGELSARVARAGIPHVHHTLDLSLFSPASVRWAELLIDRAQPSIVHIDCFPMASLTFAALNRRVRHVFHVRTLTGRGAPELLRFADRVIAVSERARLDLLRSGVEPERAVTVHNALDLARFDPSRYDRAALREAAGIPPGAFVAVMVARISEQKRQEFVIEALPAIVRDVPDLVLLLVGEVYQQEAAYAERLKAQVAALGIEKHVRFCGFEPDIAKVYAMADVTVLATEVEAFGRCLIESMAMGVPVVAPNAAGPVEIVTDGEDGLLFETRDVAGFAGRVTALATDAALWRRIATRGQLRARDFSLDEHVARIRAIYDELQ